MEDRIISIGEDYLKKLLDFQATKIVGKILKRFECINDKETLKKEVKELLYENCRDLKDILEAHCDGREVSLFNFKTKEKTNQ